jgi:hypothetical protein
MTVPGVPSAAPYQEPSPTGDPSDIPLWVIVVGIVLIVAGSGLVAVVLLSGTGEHKKDTPSYPAEWDPRIAPYVKIVEQQRGLKFTHAVSVRFLSENEFKKTVSADEKDLDKEQRAEIDQATGSLRALGLLSGDVDLFAAVNATNEGGILAYYSFEDQRITIRGETLRPSARATLVHELTHALQDQHFAVGERKKKLEKDSKDTSGTTESTVYDAIVEGDAERVATLYKQSLNPKQRKAVEAGEQHESSQGAQELTRVPKVILTMFSSPYVLGESMVQAVATRGGNAAVDELFRDTPTHEASLLDPFQVLAGDLGAKEVALPDVHDGEKKLESGEFGVLTWYFMLAERIPLLDALTIADGWGGDAYVDVERDHTTCVRIAYRGDTADDTARMLAGLQQWIAAVPGAPGTVTSAGAELVFESCDPGTSAKVGKDASEDALALAASRTNIGISLLTSKVPETAARCLADKLVREYTIPQLSDPKFGAGDPAVQARIRQLALSCR